MAWQPRMIHPVKHFQHSEWRWYYCHGGCCKMLSDKPPVCPACHWAMRLPEELHAPVG